MAKRRQATAITLTLEQRRKLENLWFIYGNYGPKTTPGNHSFIQVILEQGIDLRPLIRQRTPKREIPTPECQAAVEKVLAMRSTTEEDDERGGAGRLRVVSNAEEQHLRLEVDPALKAILDDLKRNYRAVREKHHDGDDTPDAA
jgi:hypothetical protein